MSQFDAVHYQPLRAVGV